MGITADITVGIVAAMAAGTGIATDIPVSACFLDRCGTRPIITIPTPPYYPYYYPPVVAAPLTYIEQASPQALAPGYWYYCGGADAYYPYVKECANGWQQVAPTPAQ